MSFGIAAFGSDNKLSFHSDYSSIVYAGQMTKSADPVRPVYSGDHHVAISAAQKTSNYDMGWIIQYRITLDVDDMLPFYEPSFNNQEIGILDVINEGSSWVVNLIYSSANSSGSDYPNIYAFAPISELPSVNLNPFGIAVYDSNSNLVFTDSTRPLRIDDVVSITHPSSIKTGGRGACGSSNSGASNSCHINFTSDTSNSFSGSHTTTSNSIFHIIPSAYGGLAYENNGSGDYACGFLNLFDRPYVWRYRSWTSFRGTVKHPIGQTNHNTGWLGDYGGAAYQLNTGSCGFGGFLGALIGVFLVVFTGGAALALVGGALAGFVIGDLTSDTAPSLKAYDNDSVFDTSNTVNLLVTDKSYYGIT